ncbi:hypothetical protein CCACVL1_29646 [Corchorus capsularis]|uniref:Uncharacterized protein n=1 Tax=Corchorus capsularis TaxID=210143 RepID=A0A1R3G0S5_COCAP|nr:hypothetical protein CCACVL1_29646 [Corchorus capsularis]
MEQRITLKQERHNGKEVFIISMQKVSWKDRVIGFLDASCFAS